MDADHDELFKAFGPKEDDSLIYTQDFATVVRRLGASPSQADIADLMKKHGKDQSGTISREEFKTMTDALDFEPANAVMQLRDQLGTFQATDDGTLDLAKLKAALMTTGERMTEEEVTRAFQLLGIADGSCSITADDFAKKATFTDAASTIAHNISQMNKASGFDVVIVCTSTAHQAEYWERRLTATRGAIAPAGSTVLAVDEDWNSGGAGNGLGTLYAFQKAAAKAQEKHGIDINAQLRDGNLSVAIYHTAGKGTRLAPLPGGENNNKPGVKLPGSVEVDGKKCAVTILECVIKQTGTYASSRRGRVSAFWGDQVFVPSVRCEYEADSHADILAALGPMPTAEEWKAKEMHKYGLIAVNAEGKGAQVEKVDYETATDLLKTLGTVEQVGTSLGSFSMSYALLSALNEEFKPELDKKEGAFDSDPHFWMPMTLAEDGYVQIMGTKSMKPDDAKAHYARIASVCAKLGDGRNLFGAVNVGTEKYWWDYGQLKWYKKNNLLATEDSPEAASLRRFLGIEADRRAGSSTGGATVDDASCVLASTILSGGNVKASILTNVNAKSVDVDSSILMNTTARSIKGKNVIVYNVVDDTEEGLVLDEGTVLVGVILPNGDKITMKSHIDFDGGQKWKEQLPDNKHSFEDVYKLNGNANVSELEAQFQAWATQIAESFSA